MPITYIFIAITAAVSILSFGNYNLFAKLQFSPYQVYHRKEYYRLLTHGFVHADWMHLIFNMLVFWSFGINVEAWFKNLEAEGLMKLADAWFVFLYLGAIVASSLTTLKKHRDNFAYNSVGASGGVAAITFCAIFFSPYGKVLVFFIPLPGIVFGALYLFYSQYMSRRNADNINHDAHFMGAVFGMLFPMMINPKFIFIFINQLLHPFS
jgi:membrane associated rhomboid family serine protease